MFVSCEVLDAASELNIVDCSGPSCEFTIDNLEVAAVLVALVRCAWQVVSRARSLILGLGRYWEVRGVTKCALEPAG
eukprot:7369431-Pyramimonas_sp.AAC.1